jgi:hypothetical protein
MTDQPTDEKNDDGVLYVITLATASLPMVLRVPFVHELEGFSVFRSRTIEDGRERYRLYLGYFDSATRAHQALTIVRRHYPSAWISTAPRGNLGSLDDTMNTAFRTIRRATARVVAAPESTPIVESATEDLRQRFVVQLDCSTSALPSAAIPQLAILRAYLLYRARFTREGVVMHSLRLGFFKDLNGAQQVTGYLRNHFPRAEVLPISYREFLRAIELMEGSPAATTSGEPAPTGAQSPEPETDADRAARGRLMAKLGADDLSLDDRTSGYRRQLEPDPAESPPRPSRSS